MPPWAAASGPALNPGGRGRARRPGKSQPLSGSACLGDRRAGPGAAHPLRPGGAERRRAEGTGLARPGGPPLHGARAPLLPAPPPSRSPRPASPAPPPPPPPLGRLPLCPRRSPAEAARPEHPTDSSPDQSARAPPKRAGFGQRRGSGRFGRRGGARMRTANWWPIGRRGRLWGRSVEREGPRKTALGRRGNGGAPPLSLQQPCEVGPSRRSASQGCLPAPIRKGRQQVMPAERCPHLRPPGPNGS